MSDERDDGTVHIPVRVPSEEPERDESAADDREAEASSGEAPEASAGSEEAATEGEAAPGEETGGDDEPEIVAINDEPPDDGSAEEIEIVAIEDDEASHPPPPISETVEIPRARLSEMGREKLRLEGEIKTLQGEAYQAKLDARGLEEKIAALEEQATRRQAEFQNFRRRADKQREEALRYKDADLLEELLPVLDNFERAMSAPPRRTPWRSSTRGWS